jgi:exonuclease SbcC
MRLLSIAGEGLASLAAPFRIDLRAEPLVSAGLFAITGPTGGGKSTILDTMCLALYGTFPRIEAEATTAHFLDPSGSELRANDPRTILSRGAGIGWAEVHFIGIDGAHYRARWTVRRAREQSTTRLQNSEHTFSIVREDGSEELLTRTRSEAETRIEWATGLTFDQFCRTVLLAQNRFAAFLDARDSERAALLDRLTNTSIYRLVSQKAHERRNQAQQMVELLETRRQEIGLLPPEEAHSTKTGDNGRRC